MRVVQIGNFEPEFSTENELLHAMQSLDWEVTPIQEGDTADLFAVLAWLKMGDTDGRIILWTSTRDLRMKWGDTALWRILAEARRKSVPVVGYHLDRWWGLERETMIDNDPYFNVDLLVTADGGHPDMWELADVNHMWMPPGISERWCQLGNEREEYECDVVFVGGWRDYGHREWRHRAELVTHLSKWYGPRFLALPRPNQPAIRGLELNDVYRSAKVVVGDSCLVPNKNGDPMTHYCSDRIPETLGRGGILFHPDVVGITSPDPTCDGAFQGSAGLLTWEMGDWNGLKDNLDAWIADDLGISDAARQDNVEVVKRHHTYKVRMQELQHHLAARGMP